MTAHRLLEPAARSAAAPQHVATRANRGSGFLQGHQGRLEALRPELLPLLPPRRAPRAARRHVHGHIGFRRVVRQLRT